jgi:hypothetical protein
MAFYFSNIPDFEYPSQLPNAKISDYIKVKNFFRRAKIKDDIFQNFQVFTKYKIVGDERPDNVAYKIYGDEQYDYVILLSNNILNVQDEWPLSQESFDRVMLEKYGSYENLYSGIHHYETNQIRNSSGNLILDGGLKVSATWRTNGNFLEIINSKIDEIKSIEKTVYVSMINGILGLDVGDQIFVANVSEADYNGIFNVTSIIRSEGKIVYDFTYELSEVPEVAKPVMADPRKEEVRYTLERRMDPEDYETLSNNSYYYEYWDDMAQTQVQVPASTFVRSVTNYEYEINVENKKREIYVLKPNYLAVVLEDLDKIGTYKPGGSQYVNDKLKRSDNFRLYN